MTDEQETAAGSVPQAEQREWDGNENVGIGDGPGNRKWWKDQTTQCTSALNIDLIWAAVERRVCDWFRVELKNYTIEDHYLEAAAAATTSKDNEDWHNF